MLRVKPILQFVLTFAIVYGLTLVPWNGWPELYGEYFRQVGSTVFGSERGDRIIRFEAHTQTRGYSSIDSRMVMGNRGRAQPDGKMPVMMLGLDSWGMGWIPTAMTFALIVATPVPWRRRAWALFWGMLWIHLFIILTIAVYIWNELPAVGLIEYAPFWQQVIDGARYILVDLYGADYYVPLLIWMIVAFRKEDLKSDANFT